MTAVEVESRERVQIRMRETGATISAWRVTLRSPPGSIVLAEHNGKWFYRGEGALMGASQERLADLWKASLPTDASEPDLPQYG